MFPSHKPIISQLRKRNDIEKKFRFPGGYFTRDDYNELPKKMSPKPTCSCKADAQVGINTIRSDCCPTVE